MDDRYKYPLPALVLEQGLERLTVSMCTVCSRYGARKIEPRRYKCYLRKATINYIPQKKNQETPNGSHADE